MINKAFTLVELMVVIAIIAILAVGSISGYSNYIKKARDNQRLIAANDLIRDFELVLTEGRKIKEIFGDNWEAYVGANYSYGWTSGLMMPDHIYDETSMNKGNVLPIPESFLFSQGKKYPSIEDGQYNYLRGATFSYYDENWTSTTTGDSYEYEEFYLSFAFEKEETCNKMQLSNRFSLVLDLEDISGSSYNRDFFSQCTIYGYTYSG